MKSPAHSILLNPRFQVLATWGWNLLATFTAIALVMALLNTVPNNDAIRTNPRLALLPISVEVAAVGLLPVLFALLSRTPAKEYGLRRLGLWQSITFSALVVAVYYGVISLQSGQPTTALQLGWQQGSGFGGEYSSPLLAALAVLAYGPLEVFFVVWLIHTTDRIFHSEAPLFSRGLIVTLLVYALLHSVSQGLNSLAITAQFLALGLVYKATGNSIGPMLAWTVMNEFPWFLVSLLR